MKRSRPCAFLAGLVLGAATLALAWLGLLAGQAGRPTPTSEWVERSYAYKLALAEQQRQPKLLIVGGSSAMFGLDSALLEQALGRPVVNLGVNAGVLTPFIIHYARQAMRPGDWLLLPVEYPLFHGRYAINYQFLDFWWRHPGYRQLGINLPQLAQVLWQTPLSRVLAGYRGLPAGFAVTGLYGPHNLDARGDQQGSEAVRQQPWMREALQRAPAETYGAQAQRWNANWSAWWQLAEDAAAAGGCAVFVPPPMLDRPAYHRGREARFYAGLPAKARAQGLDYLGSPQATLYPLERFFDTIYHLTAEARQGYTRQVLEWVRPAFAACR